MAQRFTGTCSGRPGWWARSYISRPKETGIRSTGIGCYFDDPVHEALGITSHEWQSFYHFTVGGQVEDTRLTTLPGYHFEEE